MGTNDNFPGTRPRAFLWAATLVALTAAVDAHAQLDVSTLRGTVVDAEDRPVAGVMVEMEFKGESRQKVVKTATTDKKGAYIRVGLKPGPWQLTFTRQGFKSARLETALSGGGISEIPPVRLNAATADAATAAGGPAAMPPSSGPGAGTPTAEEAVKEVRAAYVKAIEAMRAGQAAEAEAILKTVVAAAPRLAQAHYNLGYLYAQRGDLAGAEAEYRKAIELEPGTSDSYIALATVLDRVQRENDAVQLLQDAAERFASDGRFQFALGAAAFNLGRTAEAEAAFLKAATLDPANPESLFYLGSLAVSRNDVGAAIGHLEKYLAAAPANAPNRPAAQALVTTLKKSK
jgi:Flp pilus assembly protein TadD